MRFKCKPQASLLEEDGVMYLPAPPLDVLSYFYPTRSDPLCILQVQPPFYSHLPTNRERENEIMALCSLLLYKRLHRSTLEEERKRPNTRDVQDNMAAERQTKRHVIHFVVLKRLYEEVLRFYNLSTTFASLIFAPVKEVSVCSHLCKQADKETLKLIM